MVNSMFLSDIYASPGLRLSNKDPTNKRMIKMNLFRPEKTVSVEKHHAKLEEGGVKLDLTVVRISSPVFFRCASIS